MYSSGISKDGETLETTSSPRDSFGEMEIRHGFRTSGRYVLFRQGVELAASLPENHLGPGKAIHVGDDRLPWVPFKEHKLAAS